LKEQAETFEQVSLARALTIQGRVLHALFLREVITRFGRHNLGVLWLFGEPMLFTLGVLSLWSLAGLHHGTNFTISAFAITGYSSVLLWRNCATRSSAAIQQNANLLYHRNVQVLDVLLTRILIEVAGATASFAILSAVFISLGLMNVPVDPMQVLIGWLMLAWFGGALALLIGSAGSFSEMVERLWHPVSYLLFPLSGAAFMVDWLPGRMQQFVLALPMVHGVEVLRAGYFGIAVHPHFNLAYMGAVSLCLTLAGLYLTQLAGRYVEVR